MSLADQGGKRLKQLQITYLSGSREEGEDRALTCMDTTLGSLLRMQVLTQYS